MTRPPLLTVCVVAYNHAPFLEQCLMDIAEQSADFEFNVVVGVDSCDDNSADIANLVAARYPGRFTVFCHSERIGPTKNHQFVHRQANGEFVAHIDGDDIIYPGKLQRQVDLLRAHPNATLCGHAVNIVTFDGLPQSGVFPTQAEPIQIFTFEDAINKGSLFAHSSYCYRRSKSSHIFKPKGETVDFSVMVGFLEQGPALCIGEPLGAYRLSQAGNSLTHQWGLLRRLSFFMAVYEDLARRRAPLLRRVVSAATADCGKTLLRSPRLCAQLLHLFAIARTLPSPGLVREIRRQRRAYGRVLHQAIEG